MKNLKPRYRVKRIQDLKAGEIVFDEAHKRHLVVSAPGVYQEGHLYGVPAWKFAYQVCVASLKPVGVSLHGYLKIARSLSILTACVKT